MNVSSRLEEIRKFNKWDRKWSW